jgi:hypothetical protein
MRISEFFLDFFAISKPENLISTYKKHCIHVEMASSNSPEFLSLVIKCQISITVSSRSKIYI